MRFEHRVITALAVVLVVFVSLMWFFGPVSAWLLLIGFYFGVVIEPWVVGRTQRDPQDGAKAADIVRALRYAEHLLTGYSITGEGPEQMGERIVALGRIRTTIRRMEEGVPDTPRGYDAKNASAHGYADRWIGEGVRNGTVFQPTNHGTALEHAVRARKMAPPDPLDLDQTSDNGELPHPHRTQFGTVT